MNSVLCFKTGRNLFAANSILFLILAMSACKQRDSENESVMSLLYGNSPTGAADTAGNSTDPVVLPATVTSVSPSPNRLYEFVADSIETPIPANCTNGTALVDRRFLNSKTVVVNVNSPLSGSAVLRLFQNTNEVPATMTFAADRKKLTLTVAQPLQNNQQYTAKLQNPGHNDFTWTFKTVPADPTNEIGRLHAVRSGGQVSFESIMGELSQVRLREPTEGFFLDTFMTGGMGNAVYANCTQPLGTNGEFNHLWVLKWQTNEHYIVTSPYYENNLLMDMCMHIGGDEDALCYDDTGLDTLIFYRE